MNGIDKVKLNIPKKCLAQILNILITTPHWTFGRDKNTNSFFLNGNDAGFTLCSFDFNKKINFNSNLNLYADLIFQTLVEKCDYLKNKNIQRLFWNYYHNNSKTSFHYDDNRDSAYSILFNPHTNDGGTEIVDNEQKHFMKSEENEAIIFKSKKQHRGLAPKQSSTRFCLNIVVY
jgi:hypothetical protein